MSPDPFDLSLPLTEIRDRPKSAQARSHKTFVELQIELCQQAIEDLPKVKDAFKDAKIDSEILKQCRARLEAAIEKLKKSKTGIFGDFKFHVEGLDLLDAEMAAAIREKYEQAKQRGEIKDDPERVKSKRKK